MSLDFGKKYKTRHFYVLKTARSLSSKELASLRGDLPESIRRGLRGRVSLPYIKVSTLSESWSVEFVVGSPMFNALDALTPAVKDGQHVLIGIEGANVEIIAQMMHVDTTVCGDEAYAIGKKKLLDEYIERESKRRNGIEDEERKAKEDDEILNEMLDREGNAASILEIGKRADKEARPAMMSNTDRLIEIIEDHASYEIGLRMIMEAAETHELPPEGTLPTFNNSVASDNVMSVLEMVAGKKYDR